MYNVFFQKGTVADSSSKVIAEVGNVSGMEFINHSKNGSSLKNRTSKFYSNTIVVLSLLLMFANYGYSQTLSIQETINYINQKLSENKMRGNTYLKWNISLSKDGFLTISSIGDYSTRNYKMEISSIEVSVLLARVYGGKDNKIRISCKIDYSLSSFLEKRCIEDLDYKSKSYNHDRYEKFIDVFFILDEDETKKIQNALIYLIAKVKENGTYVPNRQDDDPFSPHNFTSEVITKINNQTIRLEKEGGVYFIVVSIGKVSRKFILDSGASDVSISETLEKELKNAGVITQANYLSPALYKLANGNVVECRRILVPEMTIGNYTVKNVTVSVFNKGGELLLGKSFLDKFSKWTIDNNTQTLKLEK